MNPDRVDAPSPPEQVLEHRGHGNQHAELPRRGPAESLEANVQIGDFRIEKRLGAGGMGIVYQARQLSLNRVVALKVLGSALDRPNDVVRFQREAQAVALLNHPGIATVHFIGQDEQLCYMAMEFIDGASLRQVIDTLARVRHADSGVDVAVQKLSNEQAGASAIRFDKPTVTYVEQEPCDGKATDSDGLTPEAKQLMVTEGYIRRCCELIRDAAIALSHAHERSVLHRDIKPENLLVDRDGKIHVIDFGIARFFEDVTITHTGQLVGTPMYMSPEQVNGRIQLDHRTDIYSLGLVLYELLTLRRPILAPTREGVLRKIVTKAMPPVTWQNRAIAQNLESVLHRAIAKDPDERYETAKEFSAELGSVLRGLPVKAKRYRYEVDKGEIAASRPVWMTTMAFVCFVVGILGGALSVCGLWLMADGALPGEAKWAGLLLACTGTLLFAGLPVGYGLMSGREWARRSALIASGLVACLLACAAVAAIYDGILTGELLALDFMDVVLVLACLVGMFAAGVCGTVLALPRTRDWFRLAKEIRSELRQPSPVSS